ncbi:hypothetical protein HPB47_013501, partial [Ixodes persulcatus]
NYGLIKAVPTWYTDGELREYLQPLSSRLAASIVAEGSLATPQVPQIASFSRFDDPPSLSSFPPLDVLQESSTSTAPQQQVQQRTPRKAKPKHTPSNNKQAAQNEPTNEPQGATETLRTCSTTSI